MEEADASGRRQSKSPTAQSSSSSLQDLKDRPRYRSCINCRRLKLRCTNERPHCETCISRRVACGYDSSTRPVSRVAAAAVTTAVATTPATTTAAPSRKRSAPTSTYAGVKESRQRKRAAAAATSCDFCRNNLRRKCDGLRPSCQSCIKRGIICQYSGPALISTPTLVTSTPLATQGSQGRYPMLGSTPSDSVSHQPGQAEGDQSRSMSTLSNSICDIDEQSGSERLKEVARQGHPKSAPRGIDRTGTNNRTQFFLGQSTQNVKSNEMTSLEMFECLINHGCLDLRSDIQPDRFSSCRAAEGAFGDVWKGQLTDGTGVAIKVLRYALVCEDGSKNMKRAMREIYNWSKLEHRNVHKLLGVTMFEERLGMVSSWMEHGTLKQYLQNYPKINRHALCPQVAEGVAYLHSVNMIHGDLKACNILVSGDNILKLTDFDYSIISGLSLVFSATTRAGGGTLRWMAPELVLATDEDPAERSKQTDIYALGMTILEIITNNLPYSECRHDHQIYGKHSRKEFPKRSMEYFPGDWQGNRMWNFLVTCWGYDPASRPMADDALAFLLAHEM